MRKRGQELDFGRARLAERRDFLRAALGIAAGTSLISASAFRRARAQGTPASVESQRLSSDLHVLTVGGVNVVARTEPGATLLVDGGSEASAESLLAAVGTLPGSGPIETLFNTHWHREQTGLNERLGAAGATIIAQENTRLWLSTDVTYPWDGQTFEPLPEVGRPNKTFYDEGELGSDVRYGHLPHAAHTDGDLYVHFGAANVLVVGDTITGAGAGWPFVDWWTGGWIGGLVGGTELLLALTDAETRVVPARGALLGRADLQKQYEMYNTLFERLNRLLNSGRGPEEAVADRPTQEFDAEMGPSDEFVRLAFQSLWAYLSPDA